MKPSSLASSCSITQIFPSRVRICWDECSSFHICTARTIQYILGAGIVGTNAARVAVGLGAQVTVLDICHDRLKYLDDIYRGQLQTRTLSDHGLG
jgi:pyruvate/2-oxoglutarate dehydrogenase complex dihydrolipoamide dehydrogenase (E3) component